MDELMIFENEEFGKLTTIEIKGDPWFIGKEVATILGYKNLSRDIKRHCKHVKILKSTETVLLYIPSRGIQIINEYDVYRLIMRSKLETAVRFQDWVTDEVLPTIRKTGGYLNPEIDWTNLDQIQKILDIAKAERQKRLDAEKTIQIQKPKVKYYDDVLNTDSNYTTTQIAKELEMTAKQLNIILQQENIQFKQSGQWLLKKEYQNKCLVKTRTYLYKNDKNENETAHNTVWTEKGRAFIKDLMENI